MDETTIGAFEAKTHLSKLLDRVEKGERVTITKHGRPVARLIPASSPPRGEAEIEAALERVRRLRQDIAFSPLSIKEMIEAGRR